MTYNIQSGFARDNRWSLEETARTIEAAQPDIVILQEVSRGWLVTNGSDNLLWLSRRLGMQAAWGPASADGLWGNAILTRAPFSAVEYRRFSRTQNLRRSVLSVRVEADGGALWVIGTHLDNPRGAGAVRLAQTEELLAFWAGHTPVVIGGDLNADPGDPVIVRLLDAGLVDVAADLGPEATTSDDGRRIDYVLVSPEITVVEARVLDRWSSDHRPVVAVLRMPWIESSR
jgi:endonuclease/exonuclease/phosphatase family metal-dependent hydrolase